MRTRIQITFGKVSPHLLVFVLVNRGWRSAAQVEHLEGSVAVEILRELEIFGGLIHTGNLGVPQKLVEDSSLAPPAGERVFCCDREGLLCVFLFMNIICDK